jgi:cell fate regulator YaaT (PSP1 superfamily)
MMHLVQIGVTGWIGRFRASDMRSRPRGCRVICRTDRGLEVGSVLALLPDKLPDSGQGEPADDSDGELLRRVTPDDSRIIERIERYRDKAFAACTAMLRQRGIPAVLVDAEHLFDGQSLYFYFLGEAPPELEQLSGELAETWEARVRFRQFTQKLAEGCGPGCGTEKSCSTGACGSCAIKGHCSSG